MTFELLAPIGGNDVWNTKTRDPMSDEGLSDRFCSDVRYWNCLRSSCKSIDASQNVGLTTGWR